MPTRQGKYIGETHRTYKSRISEHSRNHSYNNSEVYEHFKSQHPNALSYINANIKTTILAKNFYTTAHRKFFES